MTVEIYKKQGLEKALENATMKGILTACINIVTNAKTITPVDEGRLRNSIMYKTQEKKGGFNNSGGEKANREITPDPKKLEGFVGSNTEYSIYQEFGTRKMRAQPFLRPAIEFVRTGNKDEILKRMREEAEKEISRLNKKKV